MRHPDLKNPSETLAVELSDGSVMLNIRHESPNHRRAVTVSPDGATGWSALRFDEALFEPVCMASLLRVGDTLVFANPDSKEPRDPQNPEGNWKRHNMTVRLSEDEGATWPYEVRPAHRPVLNAVPRGWLQCRPDAAFGGSKERVLG